jgi:AcrR family transcriptional regulator
LLIALRPFKSAGLSNRSLTQICRRLQVCRLLYTSCMAEAGLRERSKARRRAAIIRAAFELFAERGYDATTVADIAEAAEVAPRTVSMYFPAKQDIAMSRFSDGVASLTDAIRDRRPGEGIHEVFGRWLLASQTEPEDRELYQLARRMFAANPDLAALRTARMAAAIREGAATIAADTGSPSGAIGPRIAAAAAAAITMEIIDTEPGAQREEAVAAAMRFLEAGTAAL